MKTTTLVARILLGLLFTVFGLNGFFQFLPAPQLPVGPATQYFGALVESHAMAVIFAIQLICGILFLAGRFVLLALVVMGSVIFNILLFHIFMDPPGIGPGLLGALLWAILAYNYRSALSPLFNPRA